MDYYPKSSGQQPKVTSFYSVISLLPGKPPESHTPELPKKPEGSIFRNCECSTIGRNIFGVAIV